MRLPAPAAASVEMRFASLLDRDRFDPLTWPRAPLEPDLGLPGWWTLDVDALGLPDGDYEYEFLLDGRTDRPVPDPYADEIVRFGGYRGVFRIRDGARRRIPFRWDDELPAGVRLPDNHEIVLYEMPLRWMSGPSEQIRQVSLGTFDRVLFERLHELADLGVNAIGLLPVQDSADTLNWGYGSRFFFAPDIDMGAPVDLKLFIKRCHQRGIRVFLDVVMNHTRECPLEPLAGEWFFLRSPDEEPGRGDDYGARLFRLRFPAPDGHFAAREFFYQMAAFWIEEYHVDGFRIDEFRGLDNWEFVQTFRDIAWTAFRERFPDRPFLVVAEDSWRRAVITQPRHTHPNGRKVVDAMWNFAFRDELRRLLQDRLRTEWGQPSRTERVRAMISGRSGWNDLSRRFEEGFSDLAQAVNYTTSHDVERHGEQRFMTFALGEILRERGLGSGTVMDVSHLVDALPHLDPNRFVDAGLLAAHRDALDRARSAFALLLTAVGIPMFLAGEEFADVHDLEHTDWRLKMSDPVDWRRRGSPGHDALWRQVRELVRLRTGHPALQRNETAFFYFHPEFDGNEGTRVFAYARTGGRTLGGAEQVAVVVNAGPHDFPRFDLPWPWANAPAPAECAPPAGAQPPDFRPDGAATFSLAPFQVRVFTT